VTVDLHSDGVRVPQIQADADNLPFADNSFSLILSDPPYSKEDSAKYGCAPFPWAGFLAEAHRILKPEGILGVLDTKYPSYRRNEWKLKGLICVVTGFQRATRMFSLFEKQERLYRLPMTLR
jgi:ubiquinone/menaquinone biosynthesis C-methylase UbiE